MKKIVEAPSKLSSDPIDAVRLTFMVEAGDVGKTQPNYLGQGTYTFLADDVGRIVEITRNMSPGFTSWRFGSVFKEIRDAYPDPKPYVKAD